MRYAGPTMIQRASTLTQRCLGFVPREDITLLGVQNGLAQLLLDTVVIVAPLMGAVVLAGFAANALQVGLVLSGEPLSPKGSRLDPIAGIGRMFSVRSAVELIKGLAKTALIAYMVFAFLKAEYPTVVRLMGADPGQIAAGIGGLMFRMLFRAAIALLVIAAVDYGFQRYQHEKNLRMTKQEVKEDFKRSEGDPLVKSRIRQRQRQMARNRMMQQVPEADVVVTNPTHYAVALKYDADTMTAPVVLAKGQRLVAERIKEIARESKVPMVENVELARALYKSTEVGDEVPAALYLAVAEILAYVYRLSGRTAA